MLLDLSIEGFFR